MTRLEALREAQRALAEALNIPKWREESVWKWLSSEESLESRQIHVNGEALRLLVLTALDFAHAVEAHGGCMCGHDDIPGLCTACRARKFIEAGPNDC